MSLTNFKNKFNRLLVQLNSSAANLSFIKTTEKAFEALVLADVMTEYARIKGGVARIVPPSSGVLLNMAPARFRTSKAYELEFGNGEVFYFSADVEVFGLVAFNENRPAGTLFEADVLVIEAWHEPDIRQLYGGYPAPQHLDSVYECKHGHYTKGQLRELLGLRRHLSYLRLRGRHYQNDPAALYGIRIQNSRPPAAVNLVRPRRLRFLDLETAVLYDLQQLVVN